MFKKESCMFDRQRKNIQVKSSKHVPKVIYTYILYVGTAEPELTEIT